MRSRQAASTSAAAPPGPGGRGHEVEQGDGAVVGVADHEGAGHVAPVSLDQSAHVDHDEVTRLEDPVGGPGVRKRRIGTRGDDRLVTRSGAAPPADAVIERQGDLPLGGTGDDQRLGVGERLVGERRRRLHPSEFGIVLHRPELDDQPLGRGQFGTGQRRSPSALGRPGRMVGLEPDHPMAGQCSCAERDQIGADLDRGTGTRLCDLRRALGGIAGVGDEGERVGCDDERPVRPGEAGEPPHVGEVRYHEGLDAVGQRGPDAVGSTGYGDRRQGIEQRTASGAHRTASNDEASTSPGTPTTVSTPSGPSSTNVMPSIAFLSRENSAISSSSVRADGTVTGSS